MKWRATIVVIGIFAGIIFFHFRQSAPDPLWNGRRISAWAHDLVTDNVELGERAKATLIRIGEPAAFHVGKHLREEESRIPKEFATIAHRFGFLREDRLGKVMARARAADILAELGTAAAPALPHIIPLLNDPYAQDFQQIEFLLRSIGPASAIALRQTVQNDYGIIRVRATRALRDFPGEQTTSTLINALCDPSPELRDAAAESLGVLRATNSTSALIAALSDPSENVRAKACIALGELRANSSIARLEQIFEDKSAAVRVAATRAHWKIRHDPTQILPTLIHLLATDQSWQAAYVLAEMRADAAPAIPGLIVAMRREQVPRPFRSPSSAVFALGQIGSPAIPALIEALADTNKVHRANAAIALAFMEKTGRPAEAALLQNVNDPSESVREAAALTLGRLGSTDPRTIRALSACLRAEDIFLRSQALTLLRELAPDQEWAGNLSN